MYVSIVSNSTFTLSASAEFYYHLVSSLRRRSLPVSRRTTRSWKTPSTRPMQGVTTQVSAPKSNTDWTTALKRFSLFVNYYEVTAWVLVVVDLPDEQEVE